MRTRASERGMALVITLMAIGTFMAMAFVLALMGAFDRQRAANHAEATQLLNASEAALELAARELAAVGDWNRVLQGTERSTLVDGPPGPRTVPLGANIDLAALTHELRCGRSRGCTDGQIRAVSAERPWGANNPRWQPFIHLPLSAPQAPASSTAPYVVVWIGDDARETDGDPLSDGGGPEQDGRYTVRVRAEAFGPRDARHAVEAEVGRVCIVEASGERCLPGVRVHAWRAVTAVP